MFKILIIIIIIIIIMVFVMHFAEPQFIYKYKYRQFCITITINGTYNYIIKYKLKQYLIIYITKYKTIFIIKKTSLNKNVLRLFLKLLSICVSCKMSSSLFQFIGTATENTLSQAFTLKYLSDNCCKMSAFCFSS